MYVLHLTLEGEGECDSNGTNDAQNLAIDETRFDQL